MNSAECCTQEAPHIVLPYDVGPHWVARRAKRLEDGTVAWEHTANEEWTDA